MKLLAQFKLVSWRKSVFRNMPGLYLVEQIIEMMYRLVQ